MIKNFIECLEEITFYKDEDNGAHSLRVANIAYFISKKLKLKDELCEEIRLFSPLHDLGKVGIPDKILLKNGKLTKDEFEIIKTHVNIGYNLVEKAGFGIVAKNITKYHHEKYDGNGYLHGLSGDDIPIEARVVAIADVYDALRQKRCYKDSFSHKEAMEIILSENGKYFDPKIVEIFIHYNEVFDTLFNKN